MCNKSNFGRNLPRDCKVLGQAHEGYQAWIIIDQFCLVHYVHFSQPPTVSFSFSVGKHFAEVSKNMNIHERHGLFDYLQRGAIVHHIEFPYL